ncbi:hypothetical protein [Aliarcobacter butzleri]|uniref:Uncharacterized protein n=1 Tax=Aliarcobacter butzleri L351 TaxID=1447259 RepID=A0A837J5N6_9BACT|nr:hypothetical protein [Aliarcobacter butzleri]KLE00938.1 hypothetical protein AF76_05705 [Aliarcobacter butzleri L351]KLE12846.1 hypothetical protein AF75_06710 [Aliarcobacter butzleri L350]
MSNIINEDIENEFITFSEARKKYIEEKEQEINMLTLRLREIFKHYSNPKLNDSNFRLSLGLIFSQIVEMKEKLHKLSFTIKALNKLNNVTEIKRIRNKETGKIKLIPIRYDYYKDKDNINLHLNMTNEEVEEINKKNKELSKKHWTELKKIKYETIQQMGNIIINSNQDDKKDRSHIEFFELLSTITGNKRQAENYTKLIFKKAPKHKTIKELTK